MTFKEYLALYSQANADKIAAMSATYEQEPAITALNALNAAYDGMMSDGLSMDDGELAFASHDALLELYTSIYNQ